MKRLGLDFGAGFAQAAHGPVGSYPQPLAFGESRELPLALLLERATPVLGAAAASVAREKPHLVCAGFVPHLGVTGPKAPKWHIGRHKLDAEAAVTLVLRELATAAKGLGDASVALPTYFSYAQAEAFRQAALKAKFPLVGTLSAALAASLIAYAEQAWVTSAIVLDVDDHALTMAHVQASGGNVHVRETHAVPTLALKAWKERLLNCIADVCVRQTRRDPRDVPTTEQSVWAQLDGLMSACLHHKTFQVGVQGVQWYQNVLATPEQTLRFCEPLLVAAKQEIDRFRRELRREESVPVFLASHAISLLPGVVPALRRRHEAATRQPALAKNRTKTEDFGENLLASAGQAVAGVTILSPDSLARAAHGFDPVAGEHAGDMAPLPLPLPLAAGPARLAYQGQTHPLAGDLFVLGANAQCHLFFDPKHHPSVASKHCEIAFRQRSFVLANRSREGTLVNDDVVQHSIVLQPGDWIRLGAQGPTVRFLGDAPDRDPRSVTA